MSYFLHMERALVSWNFVFCFYACGTRSGIVDFFACGACSGIVAFFCYIFSACGTRCGIIKFRVIYFRVCNTIWYCRILCYIVLRVERAVVLWNFLLYIFVHETCSGVLLYISLLETCSGIVEFRVICFYIRNAL